MKLLSVILLVAVLFLCIGSCGQTDDNMETTDASELVTINPNSFTTPTYPPSETRYGETISSPNQFFNGIRSEYSTYVRTDIGDFIMRVSVLELFVRHDGIIYELTISGKIQIDDYIGELVYADYSERLHLGYFLVQKNSILRYPHNGEVLESLKTDNTLPKNLESFVCKESEVDADILECRNHIQETNYNELFLWKKNMGLISYDSYYGEGKYRLSFKLD